MEDLSSPKSHFQGKASFQKYNNTGKVQMKITLKSVATRKEEYIKDGTKGLFTEVHCVQIANLERFYRRYRLIQKVSCIPPAIDWSLQRRLMD